MLSLMTPGHLYEPDSSNLGTLPGKAIPRLGLVTTDASTTDAANPMAICTGSNPLGRGSHYCPCFPVSTANTMEYRCSWVLQSGMPPQENLRCTPESKIQEALYMINGAIIIISDIFIIAFPFGLLRRVQIKQRRKHIIYAIFSVRIL